MPIVLLVLGGLLILSAIKGTEHDLGQQLQSDFTGGGSFLYWIAAVGALGAIGYVPVLRNPSRWLIGLVLVAMVFANKGVFANLISAVQSPQAAPSHALPTGGSGSGGGSSSSSSSGGGDSTASTVATVAEIAAIALL